VRGVDVAHAGRDASFRNAMCSRVFVSRFVPSPIRVTSVSPSFSFAIAHACVMFERRL
jgi:hypothetical protein